MRSYPNRISLTENDRGVYCLDTSMGCASGLQHNKKGCYNDCYAAKSAKLYGYDFSKTVLRYFDNKRHERQVIHQISKIKLDFVRIGCSGDPSENWDHTINICRVICHANKEIIIITKHWTNLTEAHLAFLATINVCINTSVSALDPPELLANSLEQYKLIKKYCKSVLRIVSADFNIDNETGHKLAKIQADLFKKEATLDTVLRLNPKNELVTSGIVNVKKSKFLGKNALVSKFNKKTYLGKCSTCKEMCGLNINPEVKLYPDKPGIVKQLSMFTKTLLT